MNFEIFHFWAIVITYYVLHKKRVFHSSRPVLYLFLFPLLSLLSREREHNFRLWILSAAETGQSGTQSFVERRMDQYYIFGQIPCMKEWTVLLQTMTIVACVRTRPKKYLTQSSVINHRAHEIRDLKYSCSFFCKSLFKWVY